MPQDINIGPRLRERRQQLGLTLRELADRTDLSASFLNQIELNQSGPSLDSVQRIAEALDIPLSSLLEDPAEVSPVPDPGPADPEEVEDSGIPAGYSPIVRSGRRPQVHLPFSGATRELLTPELGRKMVAFCGRLAPGAVSVSRRFRESTEEFIYVLSGSLLVTLTSREERLGQGDAIYFCGEELQRLTCASETEDAVWFSVITPSVF